jgi:phage baseplate assembly protein W
MRKSDAKARPQAAPQILSIPLGTEKARLVAWYRKEHGSDLEKLVAAKLAETIREARGHQRETLAAIRKHESSIAVLEEVTADADGVEVLRGAFAVSQYLRAKIKRLKKKLSQ